MEQQDNAKGSLDGGGGGGGDGGAGEVVTPAAVRDGIAFLRRRLCGTPPGTLHCSSPLLPEQDRNFRCVAYIRISWMFLLQSWHALKCSEHDVICIQSIMIQKTLMFSEMLQVLHTSMIFRMYVVVVLFVDCCVRKHSETSWPRG